MRIEESSLVYSVRLDYDDKDGILLLSEVEEIRRPPCRAFRLVGDSRRFLFLKVPWHLPKEYIGGLSQWLDAALEDGIHRPIGQQQMKFSFLGCSESGIKSGHLIYFNEGPDMTTISLLRELGRLEDVFRHSGAGKYAARLGLSFTSTLPAIDAPDERTKQIDDISADSGEFTTDGCGPIRESYANLIRQKLDLPHSTSVFHIRKGGIKGLLVAYPDDIFDARWGSTTEQLRPRSSSTADCIFAYRHSMLKYHGGPTEIEVHGFSEPVGSARLNFHFIVLLLSLGADRTALEWLLKAHLQEIELITSDRRMAIHYLKGELDAQGRAAYQDLVEMLYAGHSMDEKYLHRQLCLFQNNQYTRLREKLNIKVPRSCYVYGVVDELGVLDDGEVYINLPYREGPIISDVIVARNPAYKPGDIRRLKAVYKPELSFLRNCIVFPLRGRYSIPNSLAGGDLDGDKYFVCWEPTILPAWTELPPAVVPKATLSPRPSNSCPIPNNLIELSTEDLQEVHKIIHRSLLNVFLEQHYGMVLGMAANDWRRLAEHFDDERTWSYCLDLAEIIREALDITKSGRSYRRLSDRFFSLKFEYSRKQEEARRSTLEKPLDGLRSLIPARGETERPVYELDPVLNLERFNPEKWAEFYDEGINVMREFNRRLRDAISEKKEEEKEAENSNPFRDGENTNSPTDFIKRAFTEMYFPDSPGFLSQRNIDSFLRASAWYTVGYRAGKPAFAWLGARFLNHIKAYETCGGRPGFVIGALKEIDNIAVLPREQGTPYNTPASPLSEMFNTLHL